MSNMMMLKNRTVWGKQKGSNRKNVKIGKQQKKNTVMVKQNKPVVM